MALVREFLSNKAKQVRRNAAGTKAGCGDDRHCIVGSSGSGNTEYRYRSLLGFAHNWTDVRQVVKIELRVKMEVSVTSHFASYGTAPKVRVQRLTANFAEGTGAENVWTSGEYEWPASTGGVEKALPFNTQGTPQDEAEVYIDVTELLRPDVPKTVLMPDGTAGGGGPRYGVLLRTPGDELTNGQRCIFRSFHDTTAGNRPVLRVTYEPTNQPPTVPTLYGPSGNTTFGTSFEGKHADPEGDPMSGREIVVYVAGGNTEAWRLPANLTVAGSGETQTGVFSVPLSLAAASLKLGTNYEWTARTQDSFGSWGPYSPRTPTPMAFLITSSAPSVVAASIAPTNTMANVKLGGRYSDPEGNALQQYQIQMQAQSAHNEGAWADPSGYVWDTGETRPTSDEVSSNQVSRAYAGQAVGAGTWSFRVRVMDSSGVWSVWSYADFSLTLPYDPDPGAIDLITQIARIAPVRVAVYRMGTNRGPGELIGYIDDPIDLGASRYLNGAGEVYFTLPALHPYCPELEPHQTHYAVEQWHGDRYKRLFTGLITDFDATTDEMVVYGNDYIGLLQTAVDERYDPAKPEVAADGNGGGGSKYTDKTLDYIIKDQLAHHRTRPNSPVGFIATGAITALAERATIYSTYTEALPFIIGLADSHKQGTGREVRFYDYSTEASPGIWEYQWRLTDNWGKDRPNIRLEYGGLLADFRVVALGDFGTRVLGVGQKRGEVKVYRATGQAGMDEAVWGRTAKARFYADIIDQNDLNRRVLEDAAQLAKVGKRMALAIRADMLSPFDGWDVGDNIVVDIERGVVDTGQYGSVGADGFPYWTIYGVEFRYFPDGHTDLTLTIMPKKGLTPANPDLIPSINPGVSREWQTGYGIPTMYGELPQPTPIDPTPAALALSPNDWNLMWRYNTQIVPPPADGAFRSNSQSSSTPATALFIHRDDSTDIDRTIEHSRTIMGGRIYIRREGGTGYWVGRITADPVMNVGGTYWTYPVQRLSNSLPSLPANNQDCEITYLESGEKTYFPPTDDPIISRWYEDLNTGKVYELDESTGLYRLVLQPNQVGGSAPSPVDTVPPPPPIIKSLATMNTAQNDGTQVTVISAVVGYDTPPNGLTDLDQYVLESTRFVREDDPTLPDWTLSTLWHTESADRTGILDTYCLQPNVLAATKFYLRVSAIDSSGNRSAWSDYLSIITAEDTTGPARPSGIILTPGMNVIGVRWNNIDDLDLSHVEVEWRIDPDGNWLSARIDGTLIVITSLVNGTAYHLRLRSVDTSNNTLHDTGTVDVDGNPIYETFKATDPDKGWVDAGLSTPTAIPGSALVWDEAIIESVFAGMINADWITAGTLKVGEGSGGATAITVVSSTGGLLGRWGTNGIEVFDPTNPQYKLIITESTLTIYDLTDPANPISRVRLTPLGIDAASVTFGAARGGHNLVQNSSFELGAYGVTQITNHTWNVRADWDATRLWEVNTSQGDGDVNIGSVN